MVILRLPGLRPLTDTSDNPCGGPYPASSFFWPASRRQDAHRPAHYLSPSPLRTRPLAGHRLRLQRNRPPPLWNQPAWSGSPLPSAAAPIGMAAATLPGSTAAASSGTSSPNTASSSLGPSRSSSGRDRRSAGTACNPGTWCSSKRAADRPHTWGSPWAETSSSTHRAHEERCESSILWRPTGRAGMWGPEGCASCDLKP
jgi:hypothetical protein